MMRRTRKWSQVKQEATRLAKLGCSPLEIAKHIRVDKSSVTRWIRAGKLPRADDSNVIALGVQPKQTPAEWAAAVREDYLLDATDEQLVTLGEAALMISQDPLAKRSERLNASRAFLSVVDKLKIVTRRGAEQAQPQPQQAPAANEPAQSAKKNPPVRRSNVDPRGLLMVVNK